MALGNWSWLPLARITGILGMRAIGITGMKGIAGRGMTQLCPRRSTGQATFGLLNHQLSFILFFSVFLTKVPFSILICSVSLQADLFLERGNDALRLPLFHTKDIC